MQHRPGVSRIWGEGQPFMLVKILEIPTWGGLAHPRP